MSASALSKQEPTSRRVDRAEATVLAGPTLIRVPNLAWKSVDSPLSTDLEQRFGPIWEMADAGVPEDLIARETGLPIGQVELILGLKRPRTAGGGRPSS